MPTLSQKKLVESLREIERDWDRTQHVEVLSRCGEAAPLEYRYVDMVGRGSFGVVVKIADSSGFLALKRVYQDKRYHNRELSMLLETDHVNIVHLAAYFHTDKSPSGMFLNIVTEYVETNLEDYIALNRSCSTDEIRMIYRQILEGLRYLHSKRICHRDIKPSNILLSQHGVVKICDLGSAKVIRDEEPNVTYICSRFYRAPENLLDHQGYDFKIDVWSAGCVMVEFRLQEPIFKADSTASTLNRILEIVRATEEDLAELGCERKVLPAPGIRIHLQGHFEEQCLDVLERSLVFSPRKRLSAAELLERGFFGGK